MKKQNFRSSLLRLCAHQLQDLVDFILAQTEENEIHTGEALAHSGQTPHWNIPTASSLASTPEQAQTNQDTTIESVSWITAMEMDQPPTDWLKRVQKGSPELLKQMSTLHQQATPHPLPPLQSEIIQKPLLSSVMALRQEEPLNSPHASLPIKKIDLASSDNSDQAPSNNIWDDRYKADEIPKIQPKSQEQNTSQNQGKRHTYSDHEAPPPIPFLPHPPSFSNLPSENLFSSSSERIHNAQNPDLFMQTPPFPFRGFEENTNPTQAASGKWVVLTGRDAQRTPPETRWPSLPTEETKEPLEWEMQKRAWERRQRLNEEQKGKTWNV